MKCRVDVSGTKLRAAADPEPVLRSRDSGEVARDRVTGQTMYHVAITASEPGETPEVWKVKVPGEPKGVVEGVALKVTGLRLNFWEMNGNSGVSLRAESIEPLTTPPPATGNKAPAS